MDGYWDSNRHWVTITPLLPDGDRVLPETVDHEWLRSHRIDCRCEPCSRYPKKILRNLKLVRS